MVLPRFISLRSETNHRYLRYIHQDIEGVHGILQFSGEKVVSQDTKFQVEYAAPPHAQGVHIRSCYNNKYLRPDQQHQWIVAGADEPHNDTLFEPEIFHQNNVIIVRLRSVQHNHNIQISQDNQYLIARQENPENNNALQFTVIDWQTLVILPKLLAFSDGDGNFLRVWDNGEHQYLRFEQPADITDPRAEFEVFTTRDGSVLLKSTHTRNFWRRANDPNVANWILVDPNGNDPNVANWILVDPNGNHDPNNLFQPNIVPANQGGNVVVTLHNSGNNNLCRRLTRMGIADCLNATAAQDRPGNLEVNERVRSRTISGLNFGLADARIYDRHNQVVVATGEAENSTPNHADALILLSYEDTKKSTWNNMIDNVAFTSLIPTILTSDTLFVVADKEGPGGIIANLDNFDGIYRWGETHISTTPIELQFHVVVPPMSKVRVTRLATRVSCDIPFSYSQRDTLIRQHSATIVYNKGGGVYTGVSFYNFQEIEEIEPLFG